MQTAAACAALLVSTGVACAEDWAPAASSADAAYFLDLSTLTRKGDVAQSWMREDLTRPQRAASGRSFSRTLSERFDDCVGRRFAFGDAVRRNDKGEVIETAHHPGGWSEIAPGSVAEAVWRIACAGTTPPKEDALLKDLTAAAWTQLGPSADNKYVLYAALDRVLKLDADHALVVTRTDFQTPQWVDGLPIRYLLAATLVDCANRKTAAAATDLYLSPTLRVRATRATDFANLPLESPAPGSFAFRYLDKFCASAVAASKDAADEGEVSSGTVWLVAKGYLVTADHVVAGAKALTVYDSAGQPVGRAAIVSEDAANDLAILKPVDWRAVRRQALQLAPHTASLGRKVFTLGFPEPDTLGQHIKMTAGDVSATSGPHDDAHVLQVSIPIQPGNSGGPVLAFDGTVVGVVDTKLMEFNGAGDDEPKPELINYAIKAAYLRPMLEDLPDLGGYVVLEAKGGGQDQLVAQARRSVFMVMAQH